MKSATRDHLIFPGCIFFFFFTKLFAFHISILLLGLSFFLILFYLTLLTFDPCWLLKPHTLSFSPYLHTTLASGTQGGYLIPWTAYWDGQAYLLWGLWDGWWDLLIDVLFCIWWMCDVLLWVALKPCGQRMYIPYVNGTPLFSFPVDPSSVFPAATCKWKPIIWSRLKEVTF